MSQLHFFSTCECTRYVLHYLNFTELVAFARSSKVGFRFACKIRHLTVSQPKDFSVLETLLNIINQATYLHSVKFTSFNTFFLQKYLLRLRLSNNVQILQFFDNNMHIDNWTALFTQWKGIYKERKHVTTIDIIQKNEIVCTQLECFKNSRNGFGRYGLGVIMLLWPFCFVWGLTHEFGLDFFCIACVKCQTLIMVYHMQHSNTFNIGMEFSRVIVN